MSEHGTGFSLTDFVGGADHHNTLNKEEGRDGSSGAQEKQQAGAGMLSKLGWGLLGGGASLLWRKLGSPVVSKIAAWAEKEFPETSAFLKGLKNRTTTLFKDVAADLRNAPGKIMGEVKAVGEDLKSIKDEIGGKVSSVWKSGVSMLSRAKGGVESVLEHPKALVEEAAHSPVAETVVKAAEGTVGKSVAKAGLKTVLEDVPVVGAVVGTFFAVQRAVKGDWTGAALEETAGVASIFPGAGTAISTGINVTLAGRDIMTNTDTPSPTPAPGQSPEPTPNPEPTDLKTALAQVQQETGGASGSLKPVLAAAQNVTTLQRATTTPPAVAAAPRTDLPPIPGLTQQLEAHPELSRGVHTPVPGHILDNGLALQS